ncbi:hypothetical protein DFW101_1819 [Solidesulfovibrio carbinoliphilus subsp. oakridgensis]|uniref:Uncharacterized protein n=1 Tax=Solidesulfovibrio carbinoliphilus subsp. oakridgensis TaxID=694327 RepID=G7Q9Z6_9BACT|nr:hypothetical protein [Solidesulfovibrio carbinoliphilus]EHJ47826.1 hypothetical protein DFW101_1819 [Solidesulfovibrio carbinoliphilus subsp. oakridgensis]
MQVTALSSNLSTLLPSAPASARGLTLGRYSEGNAATAATAAGTKAPSGTSDTFAAEIMRRLQSSQTASNAGALLESGAAGDLQSALADTVDYVRETHGDAAATAVMGIVIKGVGNGSGGEDALGNALVSSLQFIDRNFGIASGDAAMAQFNGSLNNAVNGYFQNGKTELFHAAGEAGGAAGQVQGILASTLSSVAGTFGQDAAETVADILAGSLKETGLTRQGLGAALGKADEYLGENFGASNASMLPYLADQAGPATALPKGTVLDLAV